MANWTEAQLAEHTRGLIQGPVGVVAPPALSVKRERCYRSKTEAAFAQHLDLNRKIGSLEYWEYERVRLVLAAGKTYTPDFQVVDEQGFHFAEVKGRKGASFFSRDLGKLKVCVAARLFPWWRFVVYWPAERLGEWESWEVPNL